MARHNDLVAFQKADELAFQVYRLTEVFPRHEQFGITSQLRRAALSIPTIIGEGYGRRSRKELSHYINIALGSLAETEYLLNFSLRLGYCSPERYEAVKLLSDETGKVL